MTLISTALFKALSSATGEEKLGHIALDVSSNGLAATDGHVAGEITASDKQFNYNDVETVYGYNALIDGENLSTSRKYGREKNGYRLGERRSEVVNYPDIGKLFRFEKDYKNHVSICQELLDICLNLTAGKDMERFVNFFVHKLTRDIELVVRMQVGSDYKYLGIKTGVAYEGSMAEIKERHQYLFSFDPQNLAKVWDIANASEVKISLEHTGMHLVYGSATTPFVFKADDKVRKIRAIAMPSHPASIDKYKNALL